MTALFIGIIATLGGGVIWAVRLEGRVNLTQRLLEDHLHASEKVFRDFAAQLERLERKIDNISLNCVALQHVKPKSPFGPPFHRRRDDEGPEDDS